MSTTLPILFLGALLVASAPLAAQTAAPAEPGPSRPFGESKLLLTGGVSSIDGPAGGGLTPPAMFGTYATSGEFGVTAFLSRARTQDYGLTVVGAAVAVVDRLEISLARQAFDAGAAVPGATVRLDVFGLKLKVAGDAVLDPDLWMPQMAVGAELKRVDPGAAVGAVLDSVDAKRSGVDFYASATKLVFGQSLLINGTVRATRANQNGLLGFASTARSNYRFQPEFSAAWQLSKDLAAGAAVRYKPDNLAFAGAAYREQAWKDLFIAWTPSKQVSLTGAYVDLGNIVGHPHQGGGYLSLQIGI